MAEKIVSQAIRLRLRPVELRELERGAAQSERSLAAEVRARMGLPDLVDGRGGARPGGGRKRKA